MTYIEAGDRVRDAEGVVRKVVRVQSDGWIILDDGGAGMSVHDVKAVYLPGERIHDNRPLTGERK